MLSARAILVAPTHLAAAGSGEGDAVVQGAWTLFGAIALPLVLFFVVVLAIALLRHRRRRRPGKAPDREAPVVDPWREAGRRARPFPRVSDDE